MFLAKDGFRSGGERRDPIRHSKGYPERRDPQADNPTGLLTNEAKNHQGGVHKMRQRYTNGLPS